MPEESLSPEQRAAAIAELQNHVDLAQRLAQQLHTDPGNKATLEVLTRLNVVRGAVQRLS